MFKVILVEKNNKPLAIGVFIIPNKPISDEKQLKDFIFPLDYLEEKIGQELFPEIQKADLPCLCKIESCKLLSREEIEAKRRQKQERIAEKKSLKDRKINLN